MTQENRKIPAAACVMSVDAFALSAAGDGDKSRPVKILARGSRPIEHWFWGRVVHDLSGVKMKDKIPIDYCHDDGEVIGYLDRRDVTSDGLEMSGALVPFGDNDRASEVIFKQKNGVPYEASINFGGEGIRVEDVRAGESVMVNGYEFAGPGVVIREWPLRGVAICPYGADSRTSSDIFTNSKKEITITQFNEGEKEIEEMSEENVKNQEEAKAVENQEAPATAPSEPQKTSDVENFKALADAHGYEFAKAHFGKPESEIASIVAAQKDNEIKELKAKLESKAAAPAGFSVPGKEKKGLSSLFMKK